MRAFGVCLVMALTIWMSAPAGRAQSPNGLSSEQVAVACAASPGPPPAQTPGALRIRGAQDTSTRTLFGTGELVIVNGGTQAGIALDQRYFLRHPITSGAYGSHRIADAETAVTTGWLRVVAVNATTAVATIDYVCDAVMVGDYLEPFVAPTPVTAAAGPAAEPDFSSMGRVLYGDDRRQLGAAGDLMLIDRGGDQGTTAGARFAIYRDLQTPGVPLVAIGEGVVVSTSNGRALMRILASRTAVESGDYVVPRASR
jgi:hypothetical protein